MSSPRIAGIAGEPSGVLSGVDAIRRYWQRALTLTPDRGPRGAALEVLHFDPDGRVDRAAAMRPLAR